MSATRPGPDMAIWMLEAAIVSQHVASQMRRQPSAQEVMVIPLGRLPSVRDSPCGSSTDYVGFVDFTKLSFGLSSLAQPFDQMGSIPEYVFVILSQHRLLLQLLASVLSSHVRF